MFDSAGTAFLTVCGLFCSQQLGGVYMCNVAFAFQESLHQKLDKGNQHFCKIAPEGASYNNRDYFTFSISL